ncbi:hypothetical protein CHL76_08905 [Marinococcus halophilus]|uniref:DUF4181 domain-containing protein n=1 Tax=Marinococcus halophilus TaxID=1371 RepID=A0A510Y4K2_MARHA|nr:hypothetical protein [Marinococcus halophilus]OZT80214.1 hypothetical protein CHL76_08905 [Marinococcus halophilus]GEK58269.1 hypothetical protein MHA01_11740 [Marinococcus halophilus]
MITAILICIILLLAFVIDKGIRYKTQVPYRRNNYRRQEEKFLRAKIYATIFALFLLILFIGTEKTPWVFPVLGFHFALQALLDAVEEKRNIPQERKHWHSFLISVVSALIGIVALTHLMLF